jgi:alcohol dehydrogenase
MVLGHEGVGEVVAVGEGVTQFDSGDRVIFCFVPTCGYCRFCTQGRGALCENGAKANQAGDLISGGTRWHSKDHAKIHHHLGISAFSELTIVSAHSVVKVDKELPPQVAAIFGCAVLTGVGAVINSCRLAPGQSIAILGLGGVGLAALLGARAAGAYPIVAVDVKTHKLELAKELGAHHVFHADSEGNFVAGIRAMTEGGVDFAVETVGSEMVLQQAYKVTCRGGTTVTVGLPHADKQLEIPALSLVAEERTIRGSYMGSSVPSRDIPRYIALYRAGLLPVDRLLTGTLNLEEINAGFDKLASGEAVRQVILPGKNT